MGTTAKSPWADRFAHEGDELARAFFSEAELRMSPDEYAARNIHTWLLFSLDLHPYRDPALGAWVRRVGEVFKDPDERDRCRQRYLTPEEIAEVRRQEAEGF